MHTGAGRRVVVRRRDFGLTKETTMNRFARWGFALALLPLAGCNANRSNAFAGTDPQPVAASTTMNVQDGQFLAAAGNSDAFETQTSQLALEKSRRPAVRAYAQKMIDEHGQTTQKLQQLAASKGAAFQPALDPTQTRLMASLTGAPSKFDGAYLRAQAAGHLTTVASYNDEISSGSDPDVKAFAQQNLPMIQQHLQEARRLNGR